MILIFKGRLIFFLILEKYRGGVRLGNFQDESDKCVNFVSVGDLTGLLIFLLAHVMERKEPPHNPPPHDLFKSSQLKREASV